MSLYDTSVKSILPFPIPSTDNERKEFSKLFKALKERPYSIQRWHNRASFFEHRGYLDLAASDYWKCMLLIDELQDIEAEYHQEAFEQNPPFLSGFDEVLIDEELPEEASLLLQNESVAYYGCIIRCLFGLGCYHDAYWMSIRRQDLNGDLGRVTDEHDILLEKLAEVLGTFDEDKLPRLGMARRELYPWNDDEPDRYSTDSLAELNERLRHVAPKCTIRAVELPVLSKSDSNGVHVGTVKQLGLFATADIPPGEVILKEKSFLTVNNCLYSDFCDACSLDLRLNPSKAVKCPECETAIFCSQECCDQAQLAYHDKPCGVEDYEAFNKDSPKEEAADILYSLLVGRAICMSESQDINMMDLPDIRYLWADYSPRPSSRSAQAGRDQPRTLPWSFTYNVTDWLHIMQTLGIDPFLYHPLYDTWMFNTLFAKFRGVANARFNDKTGVPETAAVHPLWCFANHSCAPNVRWEWAGEIELTVRDDAKGDIVRWGPFDDDDERWKGGLRAGEEVLNHYCDVELPVHQRRDWAAGALGGKCVCPRCRWESAEDTPSPEGNEST